MPKKLQIFMSHTKEDKSLCDRFDVACARVGIKCYRSEFERIKTPAWRDIKGEISKSSALFLLVGEKLAELQKLSQDNTKRKIEWSHTQNWIAFEVGLACLKNIDVWVICDSVEINFPVPYFNNYAAFGLCSKENEIGFARYVLGSYRDRKTFPLGKMDRKVKCQNKNCAIEFNFHSVLSPNGKVVCPQCLGRITFKDGWLLLK
ncbi:hypothetical protein ES703_67479 [subsurface metagenome]